MSHEEASMVDVVDVIQLMFAGLFQVGMFYVLA